VRYEKIASISLVDGHYQHTEVADTTMNINRL
jgi:hypothetical protein